MANHDTHIGLDFMRRTFDYGVSGLLMERGLIARRLCTMSAAHGLIARYSDSYAMGAC